MLAVSFDTLEFVKGLKAAGFTEEQAEAQARALSQALRQVEEARLNELATKGDLKSGIADLRRELAGMETRLIKWVVGAAGVIIAAVTAINKLL